MQRKVMEGFFRDAKGDPAELPWHHETPSPFLARAAEEGGTQRRVLDVGRGSGIFAAQMAGMGFDVTAIDYIPDAIAMARELTAAREVQVELVEGDVLEYAPPKTFSLVFDSGCLHNFTGKGLAAYRERLLAWLEPGGDYVLGHWGRRHFLDWRPIGPRRRNPRSCAASSRRSSSWSTASPRTRTYPSRSVRRSAWRATGSGARPPDASAQAIQPPPRPPPQAPHQPVRRPSPEESDDALLRRSRSSAK
jgi:SAM-dependent methyltransferase